MNGFDTVLIPLFSSGSDQDSSYMRKLLQKGRQLAAWLGAQWILVAPDDLELDQSGFPESRGRVMRVARGALAHATLSEASEISSQGKAGVLFLTTDSGSAAGAPQGLSREKSFLLERCEIPVWVSPDRKNATSAGLHSILVPMSGERRASEALEAALRIGNRHRLPVDILHVTSSRRSLEPDESVLGHVSDELHHEYPGLVEELIGQASPFSSPRERLVIRDFHHCYGDIMNELKTRVNSNTECLLIMEWKGTLGIGRAKNIKMLLSLAKGPILLIREEKRSESRLRIGRQVSSR